MLLNFIFMFFIKVETIDVFKFSVGYFFLKLVKLKIEIVFVFTFFGPTNIGGTSTPNGYLRKFEACISKTNTQTQVFGSRANNDSSIFGLRI